MILKNWGASLMSEQQSLFDWEAILAKPSPNWKYQAKSNSFIVCREYPFTGELIFNGETIKGGFDFWDDAKEWACIRLESKRMNDQMKIRIWRSNVMVWQYPPSFHPTQCEVNQRQ